MEKSGKVWEFDFLKNVGTLCEVLGFDLSGSFLPIYFALSGGQVSV